MQEPLNGNIIIYFFMKNIICIFFKSKICNKNFILRRFKLIIFATINSWIFLV